MEYSDEKSKISQEVNQHVSNVANSQEELGNDSTDLDPNTYPEILFDSATKNTTNNVTITNSNLPSYDSFEFDPLSLDIFDALKSATKIKNKISENVLKEDDNKSIFSDSSSDSSSNTDVDDNDSDVVINLIGASQMLGNKNNDQYSYSVSTNDNSSDDDADDVHRLNRKVKLSSKKMKHKKQNDEYNDKEKKIKCKRSSKHKSSKSSSETKNDNNDNNDSNRIKDHKPMLSVVESEIATIKSIENGPSEAELRRRNLIEIDEDELEERIEKLNKNTIKLISKQLGLSKHEQLQKIIHCRTFLKNYINKDDDLYVFIEETIDKHNDRIYGRNAEVAIDALDYLDKDDYPSDNEEEEDNNESEDDKVVNIKSELPTLVETTTATEVGKKDIILSDSDDDEEDMVTEVVDVKDNVIKPTTISIAQHYPLTTLLSKEEIELQQRKEKFLQANKLLAKNPRSKLHANLRTKVHQIAIDYYCHVKRINTEELRLTLEISEKCRQLVELLKERFEARMLREEAKRELIRRKNRLQYEQQIGDEEEEFDAGATITNVGELGEGRFVTVAEKAQLMNIYNSSDDDSDDDKGDEDDNHILLLPVDEEIQGLRQLIVSHRETDDIYDDDSNNSDNEDDGHEEADDESTNVNDKQILLNKNIANNVINDDDDDNDDERMVIRKSKFTHAQEHNNNTTLIVSSENNIESSYNEKPIRYGRLSRLNNGKNDSDDEAEEVVNKNVSDTTTEINEDTTISPVDNIDDVSATINDNDEDVANESYADKQKEDKLKSQKHKSTGNILYKLALEEEERRSRKKKTNALFDDEAEEEEEEGIQAGLGDFGFGVTNKVREYDEEVNALKYRQGDLDHIVDDVSDDEGDENAGLLARAEMELREDKERTRQIITAVTEGHDALKKMNQKGKYTFDRLVAGDVKKSRRDNTNSNTNGTTDVVDEEEEDEEEIIQKGFASRFERERLAKAKRGMKSDDSDSDSDAIDSDDDQINELFDTTDMTEEQKTAEIERIQRIRERSRMDQLRAKQNIQSYKMAREKKRQEKLSRQKSQLIMMHQQQQSSSTYSTSQYQSSYHDTNTTTSSRLEPHTSTTFSRSMSTSYLTTTPHHNHTASVMIKSNLTLEPLHDEYSRLYQDSMIDTSFASNLMRENSNGPLVDITNGNSLNAANTMKRRTSLPPNKHMNDSKRTLKRSHTMLEGGRSGFGSSNKNIHGNNITNNNNSTSSTHITVAAGGGGKESDGGGMYRSELNKLDVENGYGMGMAIAPLSSRVIKSTEHAANGLFSTVVGSGIRSLGRTTSTTCLLGGIGAGSRTTSTALSGGSSTSNVMRSKRSFSEHHGSSNNKLTSTVTSQQFIFTGGDEGSRSALGFTGGGGTVDNSNTGFSRSGGGISMHTNYMTSSSNNMNKPMTNKTIPSASVQSLSLFAQLGTKRIKSSGTTN